MTNQPKPLRRRRAIIAAILVVLVVGFICGSPLQSSWRYGWVGFCVGLVVALTMTAPHERFSTAVLSDAPAAPSHSFLQAAFKSTHDALILIDRGGCVALANPAIEHLLGITLEQVVGRSVESLLEDPSLQFAERLGFTPDTLGSLALDLRLGRGEAIRFQEDRALMEPCGVRHYPLGRTLAPVLGDAGELSGLLLTFVDVTPEQGMRQRREALYSMIVHDLRGPLTAINTGFKLLSEIASGDDPVSQAVSNTTAMSQSALNKLMTLVNSLLDVTKFQNGGVDLCCEPSILSAVASAAMDSVRLVADEMRIEMRLAMPPDLPPVSIDTDLIERVFLNLLDNALKFTPGEGLVTVAARDEGSMVRVEVRDSGPGIPDDDKQRVFDLFSQGPGVARRHGSGIGLTFCKMVIEAHGGRIWIEDNPAGGAAFIFTLPVDDGSEHAPCNRAARSL